MKIIALITLALAAGFTTISASAQDYPSHPVRIVIGFGPGSVADIAARVVGTRMGETLGQQFVVENRVGAGSNIGAEFVARAPKDGYTLFMATIANTINPALSPLPFDFAKDLAPVALIAVLAPSAGGASLARREHGAGTDHSREEQARATPLCVLGRGHAVASVGSSAQRHGGHQARPGAVSRAARKA